MLTIPYPITQALQFESLVKDAQYLLQGRNIQKQGQCNKLLILILYYSVYDGLIILNKWCFLFVSQRLSNYLKKKEMIKVYIVIYFLVISIRILTWQNMLFYTKFKTKFYTTCIKKCRYIINCYNYIRFNDCFAPSHSTIC